jgi:uncharacterized membrane protein YkvA (DUF1232 family)
VQEEESASYSVHASSRCPANDNRFPRPRVRLEDVGPDDVERVKDGFWAKFATVRPRFGRLSGLRDFAVNLVRLFEMLVEPGFAIPWRTTAAIVFALAYFISSIDLIPDAIPVLGLLDDAFVVAEVMVMVAGDLARFEDLRRQKRKKVPPEAEDLPHAA